MNKTKKMMICVVIAVLVVLSVTVVAFAQTNSQGPKACGMSGACPCLMKEACLHQTKDGAASCPGGTCQSTGATTDSGN